jgi:decaprenyl-phosphate phosphoribosyltransferase
MVRASARDAGRTAAARAEVAPAYAAPAALPARDPADMTRPRRGPLRAALVTARPKQWLKNLLVIAAAGAAGALGHDDVPGRVTVAFAAFCLIASGIYAINDVRDAAEDRLHPRKRRRPIAAGELSAPAGLVLGATLMLAGLVACTLVSDLLLAVAVAYVLLTLSYTLLWRHVLFLDVLAIAGGFVLRAVAGGAAAPVALSKWFLLVISFAAVVVAAGKRWAELQRTVAAGSLRRRVLERYTQRRLLVLLIGGSIGALVAYCVWAFQLPTAAGFPWRPLTILPFAVCLLRYGGLVRAGEGETPEELILADRPLLIAAASWLLLFALGVNAAS